MSGQWTALETAVLAPVLERLADDIGADARDIVVTCSAAGDVAFWLAERFPTSRVLGLELDPNCSSSRGRERGRKASRSESPFERRS